MSERWLARAVEAFLAKYDEAEPHVMGVYAVAQAHVGQYRGPSYEHEMAELRAALRSAPGEPEQPREDTGAIEGRVLRGARPTYDGGARWLPRNRTHADRTSDSARSSTPKERT